MQPHVIPLTTCVGAIGLHALLRAAAASLLVAAAGGAWEWFAVRRTAGAK